jgi:predicted Zn-dependent protease
MEPKVDEISLQYMRSLLATEPGNLELRLQLAQAYATTGQYENALGTLQPLFANQSPQLRESALLLRIDILQKIAFSAKPGSPGRENKMLQFRQALQAAETQTFKANGLRQLAKIAASGGELQMAERLMERLLKTSTNLTDLDEAARLALANGHYLASAQYTWRARQLSPDPEQRITYLKQALATLESGGIGQTGLQWVQQLPAAEWQRPDVLFILTKLALASNRPDLAASFASRLVGFDQPSARPAHFNPAHFELAYTAFLGNRDLPRALKLAQTAVRLAPENLLWHERLAQVAEWSGQPQLAIVQWRWLAMHQGSESFWQSWMRLADGLYDYAAQVVGLKHNWKRQSNDEQYSRKIVRLYEELGQPEDALAWLDQNADETKHPELLLLSAELLTRMGRDAEALARYRRFLSRNTPSPDLAATIAVMLQRTGEDQEAFNVLQRSRPQAQADNRLFWINFGELAWRLKQYDEAIIAYRILSDAPEAELYQQLRLLQLQKSKNPRMAAQNSEHYWLKNRRIELFMNAANIYAELNDWQAVQRLYKMTGASKWRNYDNDSGFVALRAQMHVHTGNYIAAERDYRFLIKRYPGNPAFKESFLWFQALSHPDHALALYNRMAKTHAKDELWLLNYATTLESAGRPDLAWSIRRKIWQQRLSKQNNRAWLYTRKNEQNIEELRLLLLNDPALGQGILWKLLRDDSPALKQNSQFIELASAWLSQHDQNEASRSWLIRQYAHWLDTPLGVRISDALLRQDSEAAAEILDHQDILPNDKMNLSFLAGRRNDAADLAFIAMDNSRRDESLYEQAAPILLANSRSAGVMTTYRSFDSYNEIDKEISTTGHRFGGLKLDLSLHQQSRSNVDNAQLASVPDESGIALALQQIGSRYINTLKLLVSQALNTQAGVGFSHQHQIGARLQLDTHLAYNQAASENAAMRLIGRNNQIALESNYRLDRLTQWSLRGEFNEYHTIDEQALGSGRRLSTTLSHEFSGAHPALRARVTGTWNRFNEAGTVLSGKTASLIPSGQPNTSAYFMPLDVSEIATYASIGDATDSKLPARNFEYIGEIGVFFNPSSGSGWRASGGLAGRVVGADRLQIFIRYDQAPSGQSRSSLEAGAGYRLHY